jgi:hypothetical protein
MIVAKNKNRSIMQQKNVIKNNRVFKNLLYNSESMIVFSFINYIKINCHC